MFGRKDDAKIIYGPFLLPFPSFFFKQFRPLLRGAEQHRNLGAKPKQGKGSIQVGGLPRLPST